MNRTDRLYALVEDLRATAPRARGACRLAERFEGTVALSPTASAKPGGVEALSHEEGTKKRLGTRDRAHNLLCLGGRVEVAGRGDRSMQQRTRHHADGLKVGRPRLRLRALHLDPPASCRARTTDKKTNN